MRLTYKLSHGVTTASGRWSRQKKSTQTPPCSMRLKKRAWTLCPISNAAHFTTKDWTAGGIAWYDAPAVDHQPRREPCP